MYAALIFDELSSDEEMIIENEKSAPPSIEAETVQANITLWEILHNLSSVIRDTETSKFNKSRNHIWEGAKRALNRTSFDPKNRISVKFTDDMGISEGAIDLGGPGKEFFTIVTDRLLNSHMFVGGAFSKFLSLNARSLEDGEYHLAGQIFALSFVHGGPTLKCLSDVCYNGIVKGVQNVNASVNDVCDYDLRISLEKLLNASNVQEAEDIINDAKLDLLFDMAGTFQVIKTTSDIENLVQKTVSWYVLGRAHVAYESFKEGLRTLGVLDSILQYPQVLREAFCFKTDTLTLTDFDDMFSVARVCEGSNRGEVENLVLSHWQDSMQDCKEESAEITLSGILFFVSGCKNLPPPPGLSCHISFLHEPDEKSGILSRFPKASTCSCTVYLPVIHKTYE